MLSKKSICDVPDCGKTATNEVMWSNSATGFKLEADLCEAHHAQMEQLFWKGMKYEKPELFREER